MGEKTYSVTLLVAACLCLSVVAGVKNYALDAVMLVMTGFFIGCV